MKKRQAKKNWRKIIDKGHGSKFLNAFYKCVFVYKIPREAK